jgi:cellulose synthase/poly-beta-1,6-N-acetylglucosamine synthase-like glycosyltransferase
MIPPLLAWALLLLFSLIAFHLMVGYPLLLWKWPFPQRPVTKDLTHTPTVSILMAVHNGEAFLAEKIDSILALDYPPDKLEIFILSDGSTDGSEAIARAHRSQRLHWIALPRGGKAAALNHGLSVASGEILFFTDVRQKLDRSALRHLVANFADPEVGAVTGELVILSTDDAGGEQAAMDLYWRYELWARAKQSAHYSLFNTTGCLYAMRRSLARPLPPNTLIDDAELPLQAYLAGFRIIFDPASRAFDYPTKQGTEWGRRMRTMGGMWQVFARHPRLLFTPHPMWFHFVSHKFGRLLLPWSLLGIVAATALLEPGRGKLALIVNELALVLLALCPPSLAARLPIRRYAGWARTFLVMNFAALLSLKVFFGDPQRLWLTTRVDRKAT